MSKKNPTKNVTFGSKSEIELIPISYLLEGIYDLVSEDGQIYLEFPDKVRGQESQVYRLEPSTLSSIKTSKLVASAKVFRSLIAITCRDCLTKNESSPIAWATPRCPQCGSRDLDITLIRPSDLSNYQLVNFGSPPLTLDNIFADTVDNHVWARDQKADAEVLGYLVRHHTRETGHDRYLNMLAMFCITLMDTYRKRTVPDKAENYFMLLQTGHVNQLAYRESGFRQAGWNSLNLFLEAIALAPNAFSRAVAQHWLGRLALDALYQGELYSILAPLRSEPKSYVVSMLENSICTLKQLAISDCNEDYYGLINRIEYCLADFLLHANPSDQEAIRSHNMMQRLDIDRVGGNPDFAVALRFKAFVEVCLLRAVLPFQKEQMDRTVTSFFDKLKIPTPVANNRRAEWHAMACFFFGLTRQQEVCIEQAYATIYRLLKDERTATSTARSEARIARLAPAIATAIGLFAQKGWWFEALSVSETFRAGALRLSGEGLKERLSRANSDQKQRRKLSGTSIDHGEDSFYSLISVGEEIWKAQHGWTATGHFDSDYNLEGLSDRMGKIFRNHIREEVMIISFEIDAYSSSSSVYISAIVAGPPRKPARAAYSTTWTIARATYETLIDPALFEPTSWREDDLRSLVVRARKHLIDPIRAYLKEFDCRRAVVVTPAAWGQLPMDAALSGVSLASQVTVLSAPSLMFKARRKKLRSDSGSFLKSERDMPRALVVAYQGSDLPFTSHDLDAVKKAFPGGYTFLSGPSVNKAKVINELNKPYRHILFSCHAFADYKNPRNSYLWFRHDTQGDGFRLTAQDIEESVRLPRGPSILLAACSSGIVGSSRSNDWSGLAGSFLRAGAKAIIASRWVVYDEDASRFVTSFYGAPRFKAGKGAFEAFAFAKSTTISSDRIEDWAAFSYLGQA